MLAKNIFYVLILMAVAFEVLADILFKKWSLLNNHFLLGVGILIYLFSTVAWAFSLKYDFLTRAISLFTVINMIVVVLVGVVIFKENLSLVNKIGIALGIISIIFMEI